MNSFPINLGKRREDEPIILSQIDLKQKPQSPSIETRTLKKQYLKQEIETKKHTLACCSNSNIDDRLLKFISTLTISVIVLSFSCFMIATSDDNEIWVNTMMLILGLFLPSPSIKKK